MAAKYKLIQSLSRAFAIIDCFTTDKKELTLNEISETLELNINTTRGLVQTLLHYDYLSYDKELNRYRLGKIYIEKAEIAQFDYTEKIIHLVKSDLQNLADKYRVSSRLISVDNLSTTNVLERRPSRSRYILTIHNQSDFPLHASATGKLILANLDTAEQNRVLENMRWVNYAKHTSMNREELETQLIEIKKSEISMEEDELGDGYSAIAIPVYQDDNLAYSISVASTTQIIQDYCDELVQTMTEIRETIYNMGK